MKRVIITAALLSGEPLADLKSWLSITSDREDDVLEDMLRASVSMFETFTGVMPLSQLCDEQKPASHVAVSFDTVPIDTLVELRGVTASQSRPVIAASDYTHEIDSNGRLHLRLLRPTEFVRIEARFYAGMTSAWNSLDPGVRQGIIRLAGHYYRNRDDGGDTVSPPASVSALWRPFRQMRLA